MNFPDALSGAPVAALTGSAMLLVSPGAVAKFVATELTQLRPMEGDGMAERYAAMVVPQGLPVVAAAGVALLAGLLPQRRERAAAT